MCRTFHSCPAWRRRYSCGGKSPPVVLSIRDGVVGALISPRAVGRSDGPCPAEPDRARKAVGPAAMARPGAESPAAPRRNAGRRHARAAGIQVCSGRRGG